MSTPPTPGASEVAVILGVQRAHEDGSPYCSEIELWARLTGGPEDTVSRYDDDSGPDAQLGRWLEPAILLHLAEERGWTWGREIIPGPRLDQPGHVAPGIPWHARPDAYTATSTVEAKCPREIDEERWGEPGTDEMPAEYYVQVLAQVAVAYALWRVEVGILAAMARAPYGRQPIWAVYEYRRDPAREQRVVDRVRRWLDEHVIGGMPPMPDGSQSADRTLRRLWSPIDDRAYTATPTDLERYRRFLASRDAAAEAKGRAAEARQLLELAMGPATALVHPDGGRLATWRPSKAPGDQPGAPKTGARRFRTTTRTTDTEEPE